MVKFVSGKRLSRARSITNKSVVEFNMIKEDPLILYTMIQGSAKNPYCSIIDVEEGIVAHYCPDFARRGKSNSWCKHLGKTLLMMDSQLINSIPSDLEVIKKRNELYNHLDRLKARRMEDKEDLGEMSLEDMFNVLNNYLRDDKSVEQIIPNIIEELTEELETMKPFLKLIRMKNIITKLDKKFQTQINGLLNGLIKNHLDQIVSTFISNIWVRSLNWNLEIASLIFDINNRINQNSMEIVIDKPKQATETLQVNVILIIMILQNKKDPKPIADEYDLYYEKEIYFTQLRYAATQVQLRGTRVKTIERWLSSRLRDFSIIDPSIENIDDFLIYLMKSMGENPNLSISKTGRNKITNISVSKLSNNPALDFCIDHIKESERDYITSKEISSHSKFFDFIQGVNIRSKWRERPRERHLTSALPADGILIQWDINATSVYPERFHAFDKNTRIIIDQTSPLLKDIQPFDITICHTQFKQKDRYTKIAIPVFILHADQVIKYLENGVEIISNLLPWNLLTKLINKGHVNSGDVSTGISKCQTYRFIYGSVVLESKLENIKTIGKGGLSTEKYNKTYEFLKNDTGYLNKRSRPRVKDVIVAEGPILQQILQYAYNDIKKQRRVVLKNIRKSETISEFRENVSKTCAKQIFKDGISKEIVDELKSQDLGVYQIFFNHIIETFQDGIDKLDKKFTKDGKSTKNTVYKNYIGKLIMDDLDLSSRGKFSDSEWTLLQERFRDITDNLQYW